MNTITVHELKIKLDDNEVFLVDVREPTEHHLERIKNSKLMPLAEVSHKKISSQSKTIVLYCRSGKRSAIACERLLEEDPSIPVYSLEGGIMAWHYAGFPVAS